MKIHKQNKATIAFPIHSNIGTILTRAALVVLFSFFIFSAEAQADDSLPNIPALETSVYDGARILSTIEKSQLEQKLIHYADSTSTQIVVATISSLEGHNINFYAAQWADKWGIGQADKDNGILLLVALDDRKMAIQVGYGMEHLLTDAMSRRVIELVIAPHFKQGNFYTGLDEGTTAMIEIMAGEYVNDAENEGEGSSIPFIVMLIFFIIFFIILSKSGRNNKGGRRTGSLKDNILETIILSRGGRGSFGSGGFGSGSFGGGSFGGGGGFSGGFGGGGFGGGGASGGW